MGVFLHRMARGMSKLVKSQHTGKFHYYPAGMTKCGLKSQLVKLVSPNSIEISRYKQKTCLNSRWVLISSAMVLNVEFY